ncbi:hypothetical protein TYRP_023647 [Tyrophagus putrescentiae]|nr:hypothetical protein TYRP_023647 [Tyrophagus putrescentiae]
MSPSRTGPLMLRMMERLDSSRNSTRTWVHWPWLPVRPSTFDIFVIIIIVRLSTVGGLGLQLPLLVALQLQCALLLPVQGVEAAHIAQVDQSLAQLKDARHQRHALVEGPHLEVLARHQLAELLQPQFVVGVGVLARRRVGVQVVLDLPPHLEQVVDQRHEALLEDGALKVRQPRRVNEAGAKVLRQQVRVEANDVGGVGLEGGEDGDRLLEVASAELVQRLHVENAQLQLLRLAAARLGGAAPQIEEFGSGGSGGGGGSGDNRDVIANLQFN